MPTFCRHNRLVQNCPICSREQHVEMRPIVSPGAPKSGQPRTSGSRTAARAAAARASGGAGRAPAGVTVRRLERGVDDGYHSDLVPGLRSSADAERLAEEMTFASARLDALAADPPGLYATVADTDVGLEERTWLAFLIAYLCPMDREPAFAAIEQGRTSWASGEVPDPDELELGPRSAHRAGSSRRTLAAYRAWAMRAGSQAEAFTGELQWTAQRRFARAFERLSLPGFPRGAKFDLLATLGALGVYEMEAGSLFLGGNDSVTIAAKRLLGIGDPMLLDRRAAALAEACQLRLAALDVGFYNWERGERATLGMGPALEPDPAALEAAHEALDL